MKLWSGRLKGDVNELLNDLNASIGFDSRMIVQDITGSIAHATMLGEVGVITPGESAQIVEGLKGILADVQSGALPIDMTSEDVHTFVEAELTKRIGAAGKKLHTGRSRNDQVALDVRMYLAAEIDRVTALTEDLIAAFTEVAERHRHTVMPGYTHLQRAQPVTLHRYLDAYVQMLRRDVERLGDCKKRTLVMPLAYNKDMQEDKEALFDALDTVELSLKVLAPMLRTAAFHPENMRAAAAKGFINATDCADYLVGRGIPFRDAYSITGRLVNRCTELGLTLEELPLSEYQAVSPAFDESVYEAIDLDNCVARRSQSEE